MPDHHESADGQDVTGDQPRVRLLIEDARNRELLADWLAETYEIRTEADDTETFDLCILDTKSFARHRDWLTDLKERVHPVFLPVVLVSQDPPSERLDPGAWTDIDGLYIIDEIVDVPVEKSVLYRRLENLVERRDLSQQLSGQLERSRERFRTLFDGTPDPVFVLSSDHTIQYVNDAFCSRFGTDRDTALSATVEALAAFSATTADTIADHVDRRLAGERTDTTEVVYTDATGDERVAEINVSSLETSGNDDAVVIMRDVTERRWFEDRLQSLHAASRALFDARTETEVSQRIVDTVTDIFELPGVAVYLQSDSGERLRPVAQSSNTDFMRDELPSVPPDESSLTGKVFVTQTSSHLDDIHGSAFLQTDETDMRSGIFLPIGSYGVLVVGSPETSAFDSRTETLLALLAGNARTALDRIEHERALSSSERRFRQIADSVHEVIWMVDAAGEELQYLSPGFEEMTGLSPETFGDDPRDFLSVVHPDDKRAVTDWLTAVHDPDDDAESYQIEYRIRRPSGDTRWVEADAYPVRDPDGTVRKFVGIIDDITELKRREEELETQNDQLEQFASLVSHDLRNPIQVSMSRIEAARETGDVETHLDIAAASLRRMGRLIDDVLTLARQGQSDPDPEPVELASTAKQAWQSVDQPAATLVVDDDTSFRADPDLLAQVFENLFRNAVEHGGDTVTVRVGTLPDGFSLEDDGPGIPPEDRDTVFETGYTSSDDGTGFGLAIVQQVIEDHGWDVTVTESDTGGARFEITGLGDD